MNKLKVIEELQDNYPDFSTMRCGNYFIINLKFLKTDLEKILRRILGLRELKAQKGGNKN